MDKLYAIRDDSAKKVVSMYFVAQSEIEAIRQFKGFLQTSKYPSFPKELVLCEVAKLHDDGSLFQENVFTFSESDEDISYRVFDMIYLCSGDEIEEAYIKYSCLSEEYFDKLKVTKNVSEAEFDEVQKNGDFGR